MFVAGLVSMAGIVALAVWEKEGNGWTAAGVKSELCVEDTGRGHPTVRTESLYLISCEGYRVGLLQALAISAAVTYGTASAAAAAVAYALHRQTMGQPAGGGGGRGGGVAAAAAQRPAVWPQDDCQRHVRLRRRLV